MRNRGGNDTRFHELMFTNQDDTNVKSPNSNIEVRLGTETHFTRYPRVFGWVKRGKNSSRTLFTHSTYGLWSLDVNLSLMENGVQLGPEIAIMRVDDHPQPIQAEDFLITQDHGRWNVLMKKVWEREK